MAADPPATETRLTKDFQDPTARHPAERRPVFAPGEILAERFSVVRLVGQGGMGQVFEAIDLELGQRVAIKTLLPELARDDAMLKRFRSEIRVAREVTHPNVCRLHDLYRHRRTQPPGGGGRTEDVIFLSMEYLDGRSLFQRIREGDRIPDREVLALAVDIARGVGAAHAVGVIHRDLTPSNVILLSSGKRRGAVVTDFGLACLDAEAPASESESGRVGTRSYMAPELLRGAGATPASDVYSIGVILVEMLIGRRWRAAGEARGEAEVAAALDALDRDHASEWRARVLRALDPDPERRYADANEVLAALRALESSTRTSRSGSRSLVPLATVLLVAGALQGGTMRGPASEAVAPGARSASGLARYGAEARSRYVLGLRELDVLKLREAAGAFRSAVEADPEMLPARQGLVRAFLELRDYESAAAEVERLKDDVPQADPTLRLEVRALEEETQQRWFAASQTWGSLYRFFPDRSDIASSYAGALTKAERCHEALEVIDALRAAAPDAGVRLDLLEAFAAGNCNDADRVAAAAARVAAVEDRSGSPALTASRELALCSYLYPSQESTTLWRESAQRAKALFSQVGHDAGVGYALLELGWSQKSQGSLDEAEASIDQALGILRASGDRIGIADALNRKAGVAWTKGDLAQAEELFRAAGQEIRDTGRRRSRATLAMNLGATLSAETRQREALEYFQQALALFQEMGEKRMQALLLSNVSALYQDNGELAPALEYSQQSLRLSEEIDDRDLAALALVNYGQTSFKLARFGEAESFFGRALELSRLLDSARKEGYALLGLAEASLFRGAAAESRARASEAVEVFRRTDFAGDLVAAEVQLARADMESGAWSRDMAPVRELRRRAEALGDPRIVHLAVRLELEALIRLRDAVAARAALAELVGRAAALVAFDARLESSLFEARVLAVEGETRRARDVLSKAADQAHDIPYPILELEARGLLCELAGGSATVDRSGRCWQDVLASAEVESSPSSES